MFRYFYASTKDRKGNTHNYKLPAGEAIPKGHEITDLSVAGQFPMTELLSNEELLILKDAFPGAKSLKGKRA
jgi:hypothetical protein